jgi:hypothetical protein
MNTKPGEPGAARAGVPSRTQNIERFGELRSYSSSTEIEAGREVLSGPDDFRRALERLTATGDACLDIDFIPSPAMLNTIPTIAWQRTFLSSEIDKYLMEELRHSLCKADFELFRLHRLKVPDKAALPRILAAFDKVVLQATEEQGAVIFIHPEIHQRLADWQLEGRKGARLWERLGQSGARLARVKEGKQTGSLFPRWSRSRKTFICEVKKLSKTLRAQFAGRHSPPSDRVLQNAAADAVQAEPDTFPELGQIQISFQSFVGARPESFRSLIEQTLTPALYTDELIGWITNYEPGSVPQMIRRKS